MDNEIIIGMGAGVISKYMTKLKKFYDFTPKNKKNLVIIFPTI